MEELLQRIADNTEPKESFQVILSDNKTNFNTRFNPPLQLNTKKKYEVALHNLETYYSFPNIDSSNNNFRYSPDTGATWIDIEIPEGSYEIGDIDATIKQKMKQNGHYDTANDKYFISIVANTSTLKSALMIYSPYMVDFTTENSIRTVLGFERELYNLQYQESENVVNIITINSIFVNVDIISGSYVNGTTQPTIYSFFPNVSPGYKIVEKPINLSYLPVIMDTISSIETTITDQTGKRLNLRGEYITMRLEIREKR